MFTRATWKGPSEDGSGAPHKENYLMLTAQEKRDQQQTEYEKRRAEEAEAHKRWKAERPAVLKKQRRDAITYLEEQITKATRNEVEASVWELDRQIEDSVVRYLQKAGYTVSRRYVSTPDWDWGSDGEAHNNGKLKHGVQLTIRW